ncbi:MAG: argininosuccinate lyase [Planctomycetota bacterium]
MTESAPSTQKPWEHAKSSGSEADPLAARFVASLDVDKRLYQHDIRGSLAHAAMLEQVGLITADDHTAIKAGLLEIEQEIETQGDAWPGWKVELEDVHMCVEAALIEKAGDAGRKLHTGRSRNDQVATDLVMWVREAATELHGLLTELCRAYVAMAERNKDVVMPAYTHLQRAQPIVAGAECLAWCTMFDSDRWYLNQCVLHMFASPLGSGAIAGSSLPLDPMITAKSLGFEQPPWNSIAFTATRDSALDFVYGCTTVAMHLSRWAEQWIIYASEEFSFIQLDDAFTTGSSMMPQKRNPDMLELLRGKSSTPYGSLMALLTMCKGLTVGYNRDLQEDKRHVFAAYDCVKDCLMMATRIVSTTDFRPERISERLQRGYLDATSLAEYLVTKGVPFRTSHQIVGRLVRKADELERFELRTLTLDEMRDACDTIEQDVFDWLGPENVVQRYKTTGNAGASGFAQQITQWQDRLAAN